MTSDLDRQGDVRKIMLGVSELRERVRVRTAPIDFWRGLLAVFLVLRLGFAFVTVAFPEGGVLTDSRDYLGLAHRLAVDGQYGTQDLGQVDLVRPPGYVTLLAGLELAFGTELHWVTLVQLLFSGLTSLILLRLGIELQRPRAGLLAAWYYALSPNVLLWSLMIMTEVSFALLLALITLMVIRAVNSYRRWWPSAAGLALGATAYVRPIALALVPIWAGIVYWFRQPRHGKRRAVLSALVLALMATLAVLPWAYRNWVTHNELAFSTVTQKTWVGFNLAEVVAQAEGFDRNRAIASLDPNQGVLGLTLDVLRRYPLTFVKAQLLGTARSLAGSDVGTWGNAFGENNWTGFGLLSGAFLGTFDDALRDLVIGRDPILGLRLLIHSISLGFSLVILLSAAFGALFVRLDSDAGRLFRAIALSNVVALLILPGAAGQARFRVPAEPYLALLAGLALSYVVDSWVLRSRRRRAGRRLQAEVR